MKLLKPDYANSIMNVSNSFLKHYNIKTKYQGIPELDVELKKNYDHIIYLLLDGMGSNVIKEHLTQTDALYKYLRKDITSVFPPTTVAATNAVLSGLPPVTTGYLGWVQYFKTEDTDLVVFLNSDFYTTKKPTEMLRDKYLQYDTILEKIAKQNPDIITNKLFPNFIEDGVSTSFKDAIERSLVITHNTDQSFTYLYWTQPDLIEHIAGIHSSEVHEMMTSLNHDFEGLIEEINNDTLVVVIADHGLTDVVEINFFNYKLLNSMLLRNPSIEPRAINFFVKEKYIDEFKIEFNKQFDGKFVLLTKDEVFKANTFGIGEKHPLVDMFIGDYLGIAIDKYMFSLSDKNSYKAHHAGLSEDEMVVPLIIYSKK